MAQKALVHKQFNSPVGLYSDNNISETLNRELKALSNGTMGIDFSNDPAMPMSKPANLANSAVLKMLEEQEEQRRQGVDSEGRQSRSRNRKHLRQEVVDIDRDMVLKIGRHCRPKRTFDWPPTASHYSDSQPQASRKIGNVQLKPRYKSLDNNEIFESKTKTSMDSVEKRDWSLDSRTITVTRASSATSKKAANLDLEPWQRPGDQIQRFRGRLEDTLKFDRFYPFPDNKSMFIELSPSTDRKSASRSRSVSLSKDILHASDHLNDFEVHSISQKKQKQDNSKCGAPDPRHVLIRSSSLTELPPKKPRKLVSPSPTTYDNQSVTQCHHRSPMSNALINASQVHRQRRSKSADSRLIPTAMADDIKLNHKMIDNVCPPQDLRQQKDDKLCAISSGKEERRNYCLRKAEKSDFEKIPKKLSVSTGWLNDKEKQKAREKTKRIFDEKSGVIPEVRPHAEKLKNMQHRPHASKNGETQQQSIKNSAASGNAIGISSPTETSTTKILEVGDAKNRAEYPDTCQQKVETGHYYYSKSFPEDNNLLHAELVNLSESSGCRKARQRPYDSNSLAELKGLTANRDAKLNFEMCYQVGQQGLLTQVWDRPQISKPDGIDGLSRRRRQWPQAEVVAENFNDSIGAHQTNRPDGGDTVAASQIFSRNTGKSPNTRCHPISPTYFSSPEICQTDAILMPTTISGSVGDPPQQVQVDDQQRQRNKCDCHNNCKCQQVTMPVPVASFEFGTREKRLHFNNENPIGILINGPRQPVATALSYTQLTLPSDNGHEKLAGRWSLRQQQHQVIDRIGLQQRGDDEEREFAFENTNCYGHRDWHCGRETPSDVERCKEINKSVAINSDHPVGDIAQIEKGKGNRYRSPRSASSPAAASASHSFSDKNKCSKINVGQIKAAPLSKALQKTTSEMKAEVELRIDDGDVRENEDNNVIENREIFHNKIWTSDDGRGSRLEKAPHEEIPPSCIHVSSYSPYFPTSSPLPIPKLSSNNYSPLRKVPAPAVEEKTFSKKSIYQESTNHQQQEQLSDYSDLVTRIGNRLKNGDKDQIISHGVGYVEERLRLTKQKPLKSTEEMTTMTCSNETIDTRIREEQAQSPKRDKGSSDLEFNQNSFCSPLPFCSHLPQSLEKGEGFNPNDMVSLRSTSSRINKFCVDKSDPTLSSLRLIEEALLKMQSPQSGMDRHISGANHKQKRLIPGHKLVEESQQKPGTADNQSRGSHIEDLIISSCAESSSSADPTIPDLIELEAAITDLIDFAGIVRRRPQIMNPLYVPVIESCLHDLALLLLAQQGRTGKLNILDINDNTAAESDNNAVEVNSIGKSSVPVLMDLFRCLAESSESASSPLSSELLVRQRCEEQHSASLSRKARVEKSNDKNINLKITSNKTKIENQNQISDAGDAEIITSAEEMHLQAKIKQNIDKDATSTTPVTITNGAAPRSRQRSSSPASLPISTLSSAEHGHGSSVDEDESSCRQGLAIKEEAALEDDATTMAMALEYLKTMTMNLREIQISNDKVNNQPESTNSLSSPAGASCVSKPPPFSPIDQGSLLSCDGTSRRTSTTTIGCQDNSRKPPRDPRICKEIIESGNFGNVIPMSSFRLPATAPVPLSARIPQPPPLPTHLFSNPFVATAAAPPIQRTDDDNAEDASTSSGHNRGDISSSRSSRCSSIIQAPDPPIRRHFTHLTHPQIMLRQQHRQRDERDEDSFISSCHYRIDSGATQNEFNIRQQPAEEATKACFSSVVTTVTRTFYLNAAEDRNGDGGDNSGPGTDNIHSRGELEQQCHLVWNEQARDARLNAIVAPECDRNAEEFSRKHEMEPNSDDGSIKRTFSADNGRRVVDKCATSYRDCCSDAITDSERTPLLVAHKRDEDVATAEIEVRREYDIDSLLSLLSGDQIPCVDEDYDNEDDNQSSGKGYRTVAWPPPNEAHFVPKASTPARQVNGQQQYNQAALQPQQSLPIVHDQNRGASQSRPYIQAHPQQQPTSYPQEQYQQPHQMSLRQPAWRQHSAPSYTQTPVYQQSGEELPYKQNYPQATPVFQGQYSTSGAAQQPQPQHPPQPTYLAPAKPALPRGVSPTTVSFSGGIAVNKPVQKPNAGYYWTQQQHFYNNDDGRTINQPRANSLQRTQQPQQPETMQSHPRYNSQSSLPRSGYEQQQGQYDNQHQQQQPRWPGTHVTPLAQQPQPVYNSYPNDLHNNAPSYESAPQYPASVSYQSMAYNQQPLAPPEYTPQATTVPQYQQQHQQAPQYVPAHPTHPTYGQPMASPGQQQYQPITQRQPSPSLGMVTLRQTTPISQRPIPVYQSQPPVSSFNGGANMRGDMKWPPEECKLQAVKENEERLRLAAGPACRPRRVAKDYGSFFARHALNNTYPGYRVPPGTQHYPNEDMM